MRTMVVACRHGVIRTKGAQPPHRQRGVALAPRVVAGLLAGSFQPEGLRPSFKVRSRHSRTLKTCSPDAHEAR